MRYHAFRDTAQHRSVLPAPARPTNPQRQFRGTGLTQRVSAVPRPIDLGDDHLIRLPEGLRELVHEVPRAGVLVRLEYDPQPARSIAIAGGLDGDANLRRVVSVVIDDSDALPFAAPTQTPIDPFEGR